MGNMSATLLAECQRADRLIHLAIRAALPTGTEWWGPKQPLDSASEGYLKPVVEKFGDYAVEVDLGAFGVASGQKTISISDLGRWWSTYDARGERMAGSVLTSFLGSPRVPRADWLSLHSGVLLPKWTGTPGGIYRLTLDPAARWMNNRIGWPVTEADWSNCYPEDVGKLIPIVLGLWDATAGEAKGAVPFRRVSSTEYVAVGHLKSVDRVFQAGALKATPADYVVTYPNVNGRVFTKLTFSPSPGDAEITADVHGLETVGDGTGTMIVDPVTALIFLLANFCYEQNSGVAWSDGSAAPIDLVAAAVVTAFHADRANGAPCVASRVLSGDSLDEAPTGWSELEAWTGTWGIGAHFGLNGDLVPLIEDHSSTGYVTTPVVRKADVLEGSSFNRAQWTACRRVTVRYGQSATGQEASLSLRNEGADQEGERVVSMGWGPGSAR